MGFSIGGMGGKAERLAATSSWIAERPPGAARSRSWYSRISTLYLNGAACRRPGTGPGRVSRPDDCGHDVAPESVRRPDIHRLRHACDGSGDRRTARRAAARRDAIAEAVSQRDDFRDARRTSERRSDVAVPTGSRRGAALETQVPTHEGFAKGPGHTFFTATGGRAAIDPTIGATPAGFDLVPSPGSATVQRGQAATYTISAMPTSGSFDGAVDFSCGLLPSNALCSFTPARVVPGSTGADVRLTIPTRSASSLLYGRWPRARADVRVSSCLGDLIRRRAGMGVSGSSLAILSAWFFVTAACGGGSGGNIRLLRLATRPRLEPTRSSSPAPQAPSNAA